MSLSDRLDEYFRISERGSTVWTEIRSGFVTFVTMAYIIVVNPAILGESSTRRNPLPFHDVATATTLSSFVACLAVGLLSNLPFGLAPGMGLNSYFTYGVCLYLGLRWQIALAAVFVQGLLFILLSVTNTCTLIQDYAPACIKKSITVGLGLFQALIGFECIKLVVRGRDTLLNIGDLTRPDIWLALAGIALIAVLLVLEVKAAMLVGILFVTVIAWTTRLTPAPRAVLEMPSLTHTFAQLDFKGYFHHFSDTLPVTLVFLFVSIFDTAGVQFAAGMQAGLMDERGNLPETRGAFVSAGLATTVGAVLGTSPVIIHNETCAGIQDGGRTGLSAVTVAFCFLVSLPFNPIFQAVPMIATAPPLIIVGMFMIAHSKFIDWENVEEALPSFLVVTLLPFTYSIANGMLFGLVAYAVIKSMVLFVQWARGEPNLRELAKEKLKDPMPGSPVSPYVHHGPRIQPPARTRTGSVEEDELIHEDEEEERMFADRVFTFQIRPEDQQQRQQQSGEDDLAHTARLSQRQQQQHAEGKSGARLPAVRTYGSMSSSSFSD